jgi:hypothetical protein
MKLDVKDLWSPDLDPPSEGLPPDVTKFRVYVNVAIGEADQRGTETFDFFVASPNMLQEGFLGTTLLLDRFSWPAVEEAIQGLLDREASGARTWSQAMWNLVRYMTYSDRE